MRRSGSPKLLPLRGGQLGACQCGVGERGAAVVIPPTEYRSAILYTETALEEVVCRELATMLILLIQHVLFLKLRCRFTNLDWKVNGYELEAPQMRARKGNWLFPESRIYGFVKWFVSVNLRMYWTYGIQSMIRALLSLHVAARCLSTFVFNIHKRSRMPGVVVVQAMKRSV